MKKKIIYIVLYIFSNRMGRVSIFLSLLLLLICTTTFFYYMHLENVLVSAKNNYSMKLEKIKYATQVKSLANVISSDKRLVENIRNKLDKHYSSAQIIDDFNALTKNENLKIEYQVFDSNGVQDENKYLNITISGAYKNIRILLNDIHSLPYWVEIINADITSDVAEGNIMRCQMRLVIHG